MCGEGVIYAMRMSNDINLGKLQTVELRHYWPHEAHNFTRWLSEPANIAMLGDAVGIEIQVIQVEASVGRYNVDILAKEEISNQNIIIENQLETANHDHLGKIITYAAGHEASYIIWVVKNVNEEHRQAVDWLNEHTDDDINFFLVTIELWRIGNSDPAPKFTVVCRPNEWQRSVRAGDLTNTKTKQLEFWGQLREFATREYPELRLRSPKPLHWFDISIGRSDCHIAMILDSQKNQVRCELYIPDSKQLFKALLESKGTIERDLNLPYAVNWDEMEGKKASRISICKPFNFDDESTWKESFKWLIETAIVFKRVFSKGWNGESVH